MNLISTVSTTKLHVRGIDQWHTVERIRKYFSKFGPIKHCDIPYDGRRKIPWGIAAVTFEDAADAAYALTKSEHYIDGKRVQVSPWIKGLKRHPEVRYG